MSTIDNSKHFCVIPWIHMHVWPNGNTYPCCLSTYDYVVGNANKSSFTDIWNSEKMRTMRQNMLNDKPTSGCSKCYMQEENGGSSMRTNMNKDFEHHIERKELTNEDGSVDELFMAYMDIRFSNICNFKCRSCGPDFSSLWYDDALAQGRYSADNPKILRIKNSLDDLWRDMEQWIDTVERIYFAGGEPLLMDEHYKILEHLVKIGKTDIKISYNTNLSKLTYKSKDVIALWNQFSDITVDASLDDNWERAELIRTGTVWKDVIANRKRILEEAPHVAFHISPTISVLNVLHCLDFFDEWIYNDLVDPNDIYINTLTHPEFLSVQILPAQVKAEMQNKIREFMTTHKLHNSSLEALVQFLNGDQEHLVPKFMSYNDKLDDLRNEKIATTIPELRCLYD